jgi:DNA mismatch endonuclease Vsr
LKTSPSKDRLTKEQRSWNMSRIRGKNTKPEMIVRSVLHRMGYRFRLHVKNLPGRPDIVLAKYKTVIFVHGCFWLRHKGCKNCTTPRKSKRSWQDFASDLPRFEQFAEEYPKQITATRMDTHEVERRLTEYKLQPNGLI